MRRLVNGSGADSRAGAIHLFADPSFQAAFDDWIREWNPSAGTMTGTIDSCGWPAEPASGAAAARQYAKVTTPYAETFVNGVDPASIVIPLMKGCCNVSKNSPYPLAW